MNMTSWSKAIVLLAACLGAGPFVFAQSQSADVATVTERKQGDGVALVSPDGRIEFQLKIQDGKLIYSVSKSGEVVLAPSRLGLRFASGKDLDTDFIIGDVSRNISDETWEQPWGEKRLVVDKHSEVLVTLLSAKDQTPQFNLRARVFDGGVGFRYEVPDTGARAIVDELTEFSLDPASLAWWTPAGEFNRYEYIYRTTPLNEMERAHTPFTLKLPNSNTHVAIHEAALVDYSGMWLDQRRAGVLEADLAPRHDGVKVRVEGAFDTPWRVIQIADDAAGLINGSDIYLNLNEPNKLGDVSYFKPGKYIGIWWGMHINKYTWGSGPQHGATTENTKAYIDFAAENGFSGVLVEGWNIGWDGDWFNNGDLFSFTQAYPDFNLPELSAYAKERGVHIIGHHETSGNITNYENQLEAAFDLYEANGIPAVKTGYVADGSDLKFIDAEGHPRYTWHASQERVVHDLHVLKRAHEHGIAVNAHEPVKDTGLRRTYPNAISREGARGMEFNAWGTPPNPPEHQAILPFTRMLSGPFDFTPGIFDLMPNGEDDENRVPSTLAKQLALYVTIYSPIQMAADLPENYKKFPNAFQFIKDVPTDWEQSIALAGEVGDFVVMARHERGAENWYVGAVSDENAREVKLDFAFLDANRTYRAEIYRDGDSANWETAPYDIAIEKRIVTSQTKLGLKLAAGGGFAIRIVPVEAAQIESLKPVPAMKKVVLENLGAPHIPERDVTVLVPAGYDASDDRYPVIYMHDGQNLIEPGRAVTGDEWKVDETLARLIAEEKVRPAIIVAIEHGQERWREYAPEAFLENLKLAGKDESQTPFSDDYLSFIVEDLKPKIDAEFRVLDGAENTFVMGASMGGLISLYAVSQYPDVFGAAAGLSTHWPLVDPKSVKPKKAIKAIQKSLNAGGIDASRHRFWFDHGTLNLDAHYPEYQKRMDGYFSKRGFGAENYASHMYDGADHNEASWAARLEDPLVFLLGK
ncbi:glycoside hydrolase family 97 catalytic domain-containing protein [Hirschia baltica]|uniref:Putative esterase n=1 Tax=Hirschia baltica (strain ATCC 49814 / DSM 5838 / IFAM 1418) TaxID=582402 RepID=C6XNK0_HIRBI|nr:glycoside hydrolase family 97 catalytic domain-containing protein [Hirschia baltica]ACT60144.1 putative esterase [Hirschia baltica ATCC 49814]